MSRVATLALAALLLAGPAFAQGRPNQSEVPPDVLERQLMRQLLQMDEQSILVGAGLAVMAPKCGWRDEAWGKDVTRLTMSNLQNRGFSLREAARFANTVEQHMTDQIATVGQSTICADTARQPIHAANLRMWDASIGVLRDVERRRAPGR